MSAASPSRFDWQWAGYWTATFLANLPAPLLLLHGVVDDFGAGLFFGLVLVFLVGCILCGGRYRIGRSLVWGGWLIASTQLIPLFQVICGSIGFGIWEGLSGHRLGHPSVYGLRPTDDIPNNDPNQGMRDNLGVFVVVLLTAWPMCIVAVLLGALVRWCYRDTPIWRNPPTSADPDAEGP